MVNWNTLTVRCQIPGPYSASASEQHNRRQAPTVLAVNVDDHAHGPPTIAVRLMPNRERSRHIGPHPRRHPLAVGPIPSEPHL